jgi:biofilm regulator BssS
MAAKFDDQPGALVGWSSQDLGDRILLRLENVTSPPPHERDDVHCATLLLNKQQAVLLGEYLYKASGETDTHRRRPGLIDRLFAG